LTGDQEERIELRAQFASLEQRVLIIESTLLGDNLPEPLATLLEQEESSLTYMQKFFTLLDAGEVAIRYTAGLVLGLAKSEDPESIDLPMLFNPAPSLGKVAGMCRDKLPDIGHSDLAESLRSSLVRSNQKLKPHARYLFEEFVRVRNDEKGHGSTRPEGAYETLYLRHQSNVHDAIQAMQFLKNLLVRVEAMDVRAGRFVYDARLLMGPSAHGKLMKISTDDQIAVGTTCVLTSGGELVPLLGTVSRRLCKVCQLEHTFLLDKDDGKERKYMSFVGSHKIREKYQ
jgi:hypothetical protein